MPRTSSKSNRGEKLKLVSQRNGSLTRSNKDNDGVDTGGSSRHFPRSGSSRYSSTGYRYSRNDGRRSCGRYESDEDDDNSSSSSGRRSSY